jgi:tRNA (adenine57-N1/adenine58-N1)-methyltransferase
MYKTIIRLPKVITYGDNNTKELHGYNRFITDKERFQANGFDLESEDFNTTGLRDVDGNQVSIFPATFADKYDEIERGPQIMSEKDIGHIITTCGVTKQTRVLDAGTGSGAIAAYLARIAAHVDTYDVEREHLAIAQRNADWLNADNLKTHEGDITNPEAVSGDDYDLVTLDIPEPWRALNTARSSLHIGGYAAIYTPQITQAKHVVTETGEGLHHEETVQVTTTAWHVNKHQLRPKTGGVDHTGFLTFLRLLDTY